MFKGCCRYCFAGHLGAMMCLEDLPQPLLLPTLSVTSLVDPEGTSFATTQELLCLIIRGLALTIVTASEQPWNSAAVSTSLAASLCSETDRCLTRLSCRSTGQFVHFAQQMGSQGPDNLRVVL